MARSTRLRPGPVGADDRDVDKVLDPGPRRGPYQVPGLVLVALGAAGAVHDGLDPGDGGVDPLAGGQIAANELDAVSGLVAAPLSTRTLPPALAQERHDAAARACRCRR